MNRFSVLKRSQNSKIFVSGGHKDFSIFSRRQGKALAIRVISLDLLCFGV